MSRIARRVRQPGVYFVTTDTWQRRRIFLKAEPSSIVLERLFECRQKGVLKLHSFVLMPEHLHLLMTPGDETSREKAVQMIKGGSAHTIGKQLGAFAGGFAGGAAGMTVVFAESSIVTLPSDAAHISSTQPAK